MGGVEGRTELFFFFCTLLGSMMDFMVCPLVSLHLRGDGHKHRIPFKDSVGDDCEHHEAHLSEDSAGCFSPFISLSIWTF